MVKMLFSFVWIYSIIIFSATAKLNKKLSSAGGRFLSRNVSMDTTCFPSGVDTVARDLWTQQPNSLFRNGNILDIKVTEFLSIYIISSAGWNQFTPLHSISLLYPLPLYSDFTGWSTNLDKNWILNLLHWRNPKTGRAQGELLYPSTPSNFDRLCLKVCFYLNYICLRKWHLYIQSKQNITWWYNIIL